MLFLNYKPVLSEPTGIGTYASAVLPALQGLEHVMAPGGGSGSSKERLKRLAWSQFILPNLASNQKADLIFTPAPEGYLGEQIVPQVLMVHDLRPLSHPERSMQSLYFKHWVPPLLKSCKHILTNSNFTASEICRCIDIPEEKITVTPLGYDVNHFCSSKVTQRLHNRPYLLHIGQAYPHKNLERLIYAFSSVCHQFPEVDLLLLGKPHPFETRRLQQLTSELGLSARIIFKRYVPYEDLPGWYRGALAFVFPSLWEGFGLPILEAMACGCPVITSFGSGMQEVSGDAALLVDPYSVEEIGQAIKTIIKNPSQLIRLRIAGELNALKYSWEICASYTTREIQRHIL